MALLPSGGSKRDELDEGMFEDSGTSSSYPSVDSSVRGDAGNWRSGLLDDSVSGKLPDMVEDVSRIQSMQGDVEGDVLVLRRLFEASLRTYCASRGCDLGLFFSSLDSGGRDMNGVGQKHYYLVAADPREISEQHLPLDDILNALDRRLPVS